MSAAAGAPFVGRSAPARRRQRGVVVLFYMVGLLAVVGMAGFALDLGLAFLTKTRLQNALDAAALDGARELMLSGFDTTKADTAAKATFAANIAGSPPTVTFSQKQSPFTPTLINARYVRVAVTGWPVQTYLSRVMGLADSYNLGGQAMAGPLPLGDPCGAPLGVCGVPTSSDKVCTDGNGCFGITTGEITLHDESVGPGNYGLLDMGSGGSDVAEGIAGAADLCVRAGEKQVTEPGKKSIVNPMNSRFGAANGKYDDPDTYPPDKVTLSPLLYDAYTALLDTGPYQFPDGTPLRRTILLPVVDCSSAVVSGKQEITVLGHACMFLTRKVPSSGSENGTVYAQIIPECLASGGTPDVDSASGASRIVLFQSSVQG